ncbi:hypothetical protein DFH28DRAFT_1110230 [Melampsora americana]|nr:hypothetical protein DFH28DRAFT_1110230 [Melampsora americana]
MSSHSPSSSSSHESLFSLFNQTTNSSNQTTNHSTQDQQSNPQQDERPALYLNQSSSIIQIDQIPGLYYLPSLIDEETESNLLNQISSLLNSFHHPPNQLLYFSNPLKDSLNSHSFLNWPDFLIDLIQSIPNLLFEKKSTQTQLNLNLMNELRLNDSMKSNLPWQLILNVYDPLEGIQPHIDLINRFDDFIIGISLGSSVIMDFENQEEDDHHHHQFERVFLEKRSGYVLLGEARYKWKHGIQFNQSFDLVYDSLDQSSIRKIPRTKNRMSITIRKLKEGAEVIGN